MIPSPIESPIESACSRFQGGWRALALDSPRNREHTLSMRVGIESTALIRIWLGFFSSARGCPRWLSVALDSLSFCSGLLSFALDCSRVGEGGQQVEYSSRSSILPLGGGGEYSSRSSILLFRRTGSSIKAEALLNNPDYQNLN